MVGYLQQSSTIAALILVSVIGAIGVLVFGLFGLRVAGKPPEDAAQRVFRNSALPIISQFMIRGVDLVVAIALLRLLGPEGNGQYALAVVIWLYVKTITDFGLGLLITRDVARDASQAPALVGSTVIFRWVVLVIATIPVLVYFGALSLASSASQAAFVATVLLMASIIPSSLSEAINSVLNGQERMELAAWVNIGISVTRAPLAVALGASALGVTGVALAALATSTLSAVVFVIIWKRMELGRITWWSGSEAMLNLAREGWPLLVNALLVSLFFRIDVFIIEAVNGATALGLYDAAYKLINLLTIFPAYATLAVFPILAQRAHDDDAIQRAYHRTAYMLLILACLATVAAVAGSELAIRILAGQEYLPDAANLLRVLVLFAPISFVNGAYQYVLIARGQQRKLVPAFVAAFSYNIVANIVAIPIFGTMAAAVNTVVTEVVILVALIVIARDTAVRVLDRTFLMKAWKPIACTVAGIGMGLIYDAPSLLQIAAAVGTTVVLGIILRVIGPDERHLAMRIIKRESPSPPDPSAVSNA